MREIELGEINEKRLEAVQRIMFKKRSIFIQGNPLWEDELMPKEIVALFIQMIQSFTSAHIAISLRDKYSKIMILFQISFKEEKVLIPINYRCPEDNPKKIKIVITIEKKKQCKHCKAWNHSRSDFCLECGSPLPFR